MDIGCTLGITAVALGLSAMFYGYKLKTDKKSVVLEKNDQEHEKKHHHNEERIKELEKKNGAEQKQIDDLKEKLEEVRKDKGELKDLVIKLQDRIINYGIKKPPHQQFNKQKPPQKGGWNEIHEAIKKHRKDLESEEKEDQELELIDQQQKEDNFLTYKGALEPNGKNDKERFYRCRLKLQKKKKKKEVKSDGGAGI
ncbi:11635_t:CDS:2, partial [Ambispora leptoticha]